MSNQESLSLTHLPREVVVRLLRQQGCTQITSQTLEADRAAGAPIAEDGTVNLIAYAAWLAKDLAHGS